MEDGDSFFLCWMDFPGDGEWRMMEYSISIRRKEQF